jgi:hypothetical protein
MAEVIKEDGRYHVYAGPRLIDSFNTRRDAESLARDLDREQLAVDARRSRRYRDIESPRARLERRRQRGSSDLKVTAVLGGIAIGAAIVYGHIANKHK